MEGQEKQEECNYTKPNLRIAFNIFFNNSFSEIYFTKMATRNCPGMDSVIKPVDTIPEDKKVRVQRTQSTFDLFEKPTNQVKRVHSENYACINLNKSSSTGRVS